MQFSEELIKRLLKADVVAVLTGAGISAESGIPTFRDPDGLWQKFRPEQLANFEAFMADPDFVWKWYQHRREIMHSVEPNPGHYALAEMEKLFNEFHVITQNIDNLHNRAGSKNVIELHGNIERNYCIECKESYSDIPMEQENVLKCKCGGLIRPDVVWFGEMLPHNALRSAESWTNCADVFFTIGTSAEVYPAAMMPMIAMQAGAYVVEINKNPTNISGDVHEVIQGNSGEILSELLKEIKSKK